MAPVLPLKVEWFLSYDLLIFAKNMNFPMILTKFKIYYLRCFDTKKAYLYTILKYLDGSKMYHMYFLP